jgi:hypothetical protein
MNKRSLVLIVSGWLFVDLAGCTPAGTPAAPAVDNTPSKPSNGKPDAATGTTTPDAGKPSDPVTPKPAMDATAPDTRDPQPDPIVPGDDAGKGDASPSASDGGAPPEPPVDDVPDGGVTSDGGAAAIVVGVRTSLRSDLAARWTGVRKSMSMDNGVPVFTGVFEANKFGGPQGHNIRLPIKPGHEYTFEYRIRFDGNFDFSRGGKIPGLAGGNAPTGCVNVDANGFSARMMWRENGKLIGYLYDQDQSVDCGDGIATPFTFTRDMWHQVKERVRINTGKNHDGILQVWLNDKMVIDRSNVEYMVESPTNRINTVLFHSFFGGSTQDWAPSRQVSISFSEPFVTIVAE